MTDTAIFQAPAVRTPNPCLMATCWGVLAVWGTATFVGAAVPLAAPLAGAIAGPSLMIFVALLATAAYGWRGALLFAVSAFLIALALENLSIATGFPFGFFTHTDEFGAKIGAVPIAVALGYFMFGVPAWLLTHILLGRGVPKWAHALIAAFVVTHFDLVHDPIGATAHGFWHFRYPSGLYGVPISNYFGWLVTALTIFGVWSLAVCRVEQAPTLAVRRFWSLPIAFWALTAAQYPLFYAVSPGGTVSAGSAVLPISDIYETATINALLVMGFVVLLASVRLISSEDTDNIKRGA